MRLTPTERRLLECLIKHENNFIASQDLSREALAAYYSRYDDNSNLKVHICRLRKKIKPHADILSEHSRGYKLVKGGNQ